MTTLRYIPLLLASLAGAMLLLPSAKAQRDVPPPSAARWDYSRSIIGRESEGKTLRIDFALAPRTELRTQELMAIHPAYVSEDGSRRVEMEPFFIAGNTRWKIISRRKTLRNIHPDEPGNGELHRMTDISKTDGILRTVRTLPYEEWMGNGHLEIREEAYGCAECGLTTTDEHPLLTPHFFRTKDYAYLYPIPAASSHKRFTDAIECYIRFELDKDILKPHFEHNEERLAELDAFVNRNRDILGTELKAVTVQGYACPFATWAHNVDLTARRAKTFAAYIKDTYPELAAAETFDVRGEAEDWPGLRKALAESDEPRKQELIAIIDKYDTDTERERAFVQLDGGETARRVQKRFYPPLRRSVVTLTFDARAYTDGELTRVYETKPEALSAEELGRLGQQLRGSSKNPVAVYRTLFATYPEMREARLSYASALLEYEKNARAALDVLEPLGDDPDALFMSAVARDMRGEWVEAEELLARAAEAGSVQARSYRERIEQGR